MAVLNTISEAWGWTGICPVSVVATNAFGNLIVRAGDETYWRICPEELSCGILAQNVREYLLLWASQDFQSDWQMTSLVEIALVTLGPISPDCCYCLKIPAVLGGTYTAENFGTISRHELIASSGNIAEQIKDVPDGESIVLKLT